jgi:hypothetical protein
MTLRATKKLVELLGNLMGMGPFGRPGGEENDVHLVQRYCDLAECLPHDPLAPVSIDRVPKTLSCDEGDLTLVAFVAGLIDQPHKMAILTTSLGEHPLELKLGFDGSHHMLDGELLTALGTTTSEDVTPSLGGHA